MRRNDSGPGKLACKLDAGSDDEARRSLSTFDRVWVTPTTFEVYLRVPVSSGVRLRQSPLQTRHRAAPSSGRPILARRWRCRAGLEMGHDSLPRMSSDDATLKSVIIIDSSHLHWRIQRTLTDWRTSSRRNAMQISSLRSSLAAQRSHSQGRRTVHCRVASATDSSSSQPLKVSMVGGLTASKKKSPPFPYPLTRSPLARRPGVPRVSEKHRGRRGHPWRPVPKRL